MEQPKYTSCLRPLNTEILVKQLYEGKSINLVGHPDAGRARMLDDIVRCATATKHIRLNMKAYRNSYEALLKSIATQMGIAYHEDTSMADLTAIISRQSVKVFMLIDNFDAVLDNPELDSKYTRSFFDTLNSFKNQANISLLCATTKPHENSSIYIGGRDFGTSWLELQGEGLRDLDIENVEIELDRQLTNSDLWKNTDADTKKMYLNEIFAEKNNYEFLCYVAKQFQLQNSTDIATLSVEEKIKRWRKEFEDLQPTKTAAKQARALRKGVKGWWIRFEMSKLAKLLPVRVILNFINEFRNKKE